MLFQTIFTLIWAATFVAAFPSFSLPKWNWSRSAVEAPHVAQVQEAPVEVHSVVAVEQGGFCVQAPVEQPKPEQKTQEPPKEESAGPTQNLAPSVHWSCDTKALKNVEPIAPQQDSQVYYGQSDPAKEGYYAYLTFRFNLPSVNLDHSDYIKVKYTDNNMELLFQTPESFKRAVGSWDTENELLLIGTVEGCAGPVANDRCYFHAKSLKIDETAKTIVANGQPENPETLMDSADTEWGMWTPGSHSGGNVTESSGHRFNWTSNASGKNASDSTHDEHGLATADFGPFFDSALDDKMGYEELPSSSLSFLQQLIAEGEATSTQNSSSTCGDAAQGNLRRRRVLQPRGFFKKLWDGFVSGIKSAYNTVADALSIGGDFKEPISWDLPGASVPKETSPFGDNSIALFKHEQVSDSGDFQEHVNIYCVDCGVSGQAVISGKAKITPLKGIFDGELALNTNLKIALKVGVDAQVKFSQTIQQDLFTVGLPGLSFGIVTVGPYVSVAAKVGLEAAASGKLLVGAEMGLTQATAVLYIFDPSKSTANGWTPYFKPVLDAEGEVMLAATAALPISIKVGLKVASFETALGLTDEPAISAVAQVAGTVGYSAADGFKAGLKDIDGCTGIATSLNWSNKLTLDILGITQKVLADTGLQPIVKGCLNLKKAVATTQNSPNKLPALPSSAPNAPHRFTNTTTASNKPPAVVQSSNTAQNISCEGAYETRPQIFKSDHKFDLAPLLTSTGTSMVASCDDGNIYVAATSNQTNIRCNTMWPTTEEAIVPFDGSLDVMHYYASTMNAVGVSRLRSSPSYKVPKDAVVIVLVPAPSVDGSIFYMAADANQEVFYPIVCDFVDKAAPRVFLAKDVSEGIKMLEGGTVAQSITGAQVEKCFGLSLAPQA